MRRPDGRLAASTSSDRRRALGLELYESSITVAPDGALEYRAAMLAGRQAGEAVGDVGQRHAQLDADRRGRQRIQQVAVAGQAQRETHVTGRSGDVGMRAADAAIVHRRGPHVGARRQAERHDPAGERRRPRHHQRVVGVADQQRVRAGLLEDLGLGIGNRVARAEVADVGVADVGPHPHVGLGDVHQHPDLAGVVHAQFHHRDVGCGAQLDERDRQAQVVVQVAAVLDHAVSRAEHGGDGVLGGGLAGAAGDRHDAGPRGAPHRPGQVLQRLQRVGDLDDHRIGARRDVHRPLNDDTGGAAGDRRRHEVVTVARRRRWRRTARPGARLRESMATAPRRRPGVPASCRPEVERTRSAAV